ncbi:hypothetical protein [Nonomuraea sp. NPDC003214]
MMSTPIYDELAAEYHLPQLAPAPAGLAPARVLDTPPILTPPAPAPQPAVGHWFTPRIPPEPVAGTPAAA